jgi:hypothetical protein
MKDDPPALMTAAVGKTVLAVPGRAEARALTDCCPKCTQPTQPASVIDVDGSHAGGRYGSYRCAKCSFAWLCWWGLPFAWRRSPRPPVEESTVKASVGGEASEQPPPARRRRARPSPHHH